MNNSHWDARIKALMEQVGMVNSMSLYQAFKQFHNELDQVYRASLAAPVADDKDKRIADLELALQFLTAQVDATVDVLQEQFATPSTPLPDIVRAIGLALNATHGTIATDLVGAEPNETSWRVDHSKEIAMLAQLAAPVAEPEPFAWLIESNIENRKIIYAYEQDAKQKIAELGTGTGWSAYEITPLYTAPQGASK